MKDKIMDILNKYQSNGTLFHNTKCIDPMDFHKIANDILNLKTIENTKTFQFKITYLENGSVKTEQYDKEFTPFELLGIITHIKNEIEVDLLHLSNKQ